MKKTLIYSIKIIGWIIQTVIFMLVLILFLIQTQPVKNKLAGIASSQFSEKINGNMSVAEIHGNFFTHIILKNISITQQADTLFSVDEISAHYELWSLLNKKIKISSIKIVHPQTNLVQINDSVWNVQQILIPSETEEDTTEFAFPYSVEVSLFQIEEGRVLIESPDTIIPHEIAHLNTSMALVWSPLQKTFELKELQLKTVAPNFELQNLSFVLNQSNEQLQLSNFNIKTADNKVLGNAQYGLQTQRLGNSNVASEDINVHEFDFFLPQLNVPWPSKMQLSAHLQNNILDASMVLEEKRQKLQLNLNSQNLTDVFLYHTDSILTYDGFFVFENINLAFWLQDPDLTSSFTGNIAVQGKGTDLQHVEISTSGALKEGTWGTNTFHKLNFNFHLKQQNIDGWLNGNTNFGSITMRCDVKNVLKDPTYSIHANTKHLNIAKLLNVDSLTSDLNVNVAIVGSGLSRETANVETDLSMYASSFNQIWIDTLRTHLRYAKDNVQLDSFIVHTPTLNISAFGNYSFLSNTQLWLNINYSNLSEFASFLPSTNMQSAGNISAYLSGTADSLQLESTVHMRASNYENIKLDSLTLHSVVQRTKTDTSVIAKLIIYHLENETITIDTLQIDAQAQPDSVFAKAKIDASEWQTSLNACVALGQRLRIHLLNWDIDFKGEEWTLQNPAYVELDSARYFVHNFKWASNKMDSSQYIVAEGTVLRNGDEDFNIQLTNIDVKQLLDMAQLEMDASGKLNANINLNGTAQAPELGGNFVWENAEINSYVFTNFSGDVNYEDNSLVSTAKMVLKERGNVLLESTIPFFFRLDSMTLLLDTDAPLNILFVVEKFPLAALPIEQIVEDLDGYLTGEIKVKGSIDEPDPTGHMQLTEATLNIPEYGVNYRNIGLRLDVEKDKISLANFNISTADGDVSASGAVDFSSGFYKGDYKNSQINIDFDKFNPVNHKQFNAQLTGNMNVKGENGDFVFSGDVTIPKAEVYLPAILSRMGKIQASTMPKPILMRELDQMQIATDSLSQTQPIAIADTINTDILEHLTGSLKLKIPKNTWVKNDNMRMELSGDLEVLKHATFMEMFGDIKVVRGQYDLLGKTFIIKEGIIQFQGGEELIPDLQLQATYTFRNAQRTEQKLALSITGKATAPKVSFTLNEKTITEGDALSYLFFGKSLNELTINQQDNMSNANAGSLATTAAASILSSQITKYLGDKLNVDYFELKSNGNFDNATVVVGKYITNDLFVSYEQRFGGGNNEEIARYQVLMEYELFSFLFFQLNNSSSNSGFDVIFKFDK